MRGEERGASGERYYPSRRTRAGSIRAARRAGSHPAPAPIALSTSAAVTSVAGSRGCKPNSSVETNRAAHSDSAAPTATPTPTSTATRERTSRTAPDGPAPPLELGIERVTTSRYGLMMMSVPSWNMVGRLRIAHGERTGEVQEVGVVGWWRSEQVVLNKIRVGPAASGDCRHHRGRCRVGTQAQPGHQPLDGHELRQMLEQNLPE